MEPNVNLLSQTNLSLIFEAESDISPPLPHVIYNNPDIASSCPNTPVPPINVSGSIIYLPGNGYTHQYRF